MIKIYDRDKFKGEIRAINGPFSIAYFGREEPSNATMQGGLNFRGKDDQNCFRKGGGLRSMYVVI